MREILTEMLVHGRAIDITNEVIPDRRHFYFDGYDEDEETTEIRIEAYIDTENQNELFYVLYELEEGKDSEDPDEWCIEFISDIKGLHADFPSLIQRMARYALHTDREFTIEGVSVKEYFSEDDIDHRYAFLNLPPEEGVSAIK